MFRRFLPLALLAIPLAVACSVSEAPSSIPAGAEGQNPSDNGTLGVVQNTPPTTEKGNTDAGTATSLCGVLTACTPDDDGTLALPESQRCATPKGTDAGAAQAKNADASTADRACRVTVSTDGPSCPASDAPNADTQGIDGVACQADTDCAPGFDCVAAGPNEKNNVCRRYCCSGSCEGVSAHNGGPTFCDVQKVVRSVASPTPLVAPVCMPIKKCTLLKDGDCSSVETCAIVNDKGATGCVPIEKDQVEDHSCEKQHCAAGYTCLGSPGDRTCYKLCKTTGGGQECGEDYACTTSSAFLDTTFGVCKRAQ